MPHPYKSITCNGKKSHAPIRIYSYASYEFHQELLNTLIWGKLKDADALIIDLRYGLGGAESSYLNIFNTNIPSLRMYNRDGTETVFDSQWRKPAVYLVNAFSRKLTDDE